MTKTTKHHYLILFLSFLIAVFIYFLLGKNQEKRISYKIFEEKTGWGYDILVNDSIYIHQEMIPAISSSTGFQYPFQAEKAARLVLKKINSKLAPRITTFELRDIIGEHK